MTWFYLAHDMMMWLWVILVNFSWRVSKAYDVPFAQFNCLGTSAKIERQPAKIATWTPHIENCRRIWRKNVLRALDADPLELWNIFEYHLIILIPLVFPEQHLDISKYIYKANLNPVTVGEKSNHLYAGNPINLHYPLLQRFGRTQYIMIYKYIYIYTL